MTKAVQISSTGGPEVMSLVDIPLAKPGAGAGSSSCRWA